MKKKILFLTFLVTASVFIYNFYNPVSETANSAIPPQPNNGDKFLAGCMASAGYINQYYDELGSNFIHHYIGTAEPDPNNPYVDPQKHTPYGWLLGNDYLYSPVPTIDIRSKLTDIYSHNGSRILWQRPKIEWLAYGQSSTYQAEWISPNHDYWFYAFQQNSGVSIPDYEFNNGDSVLHCSSIELGPNAQFVLKRLKANSEQCRKEETATSNQWQADNECRWFIKPRIRIPAGLPYSNEQLPICSLKVIAQDGTILRNVIIRAGNFKDNQHPYTGQYIEEYFNLPPSDSLAVQGAWGDQSWYNARGNNPNENYWNKTDIQVYWYDNCDMWIDYVKVENDVADKLLKGYYDNPLDPEHQWIKQEVKAAYDPSASEQKVQAFYIELAEFNNIPCIAYLNQKIKEYSGNTIGFTYDLLTFYQYHMPNGSRGEIITTEKLKRMWYERVQPLQIFLGDPYPINSMPANGCFGNNWAQFSQIPNTLFPPNPPRPDYVLAIQTSPATYDAWLQGMLDTVCGLYMAGGCEQDGPMLPGVFMYLMKQGNAVSKECNIPFIAMLQAHQWSCSNAAGNGPGEMDREPTNEELNLMTNLAVSYGAKGIIYWWYPSFDNDKCSHGLGLLAPPSNNSPRYQNVYGQPKWESSKTMIDRLQNKWGQTLMSFDNTQTNSYIYRLERDQCLNESYFHDIVTYKQSNIQEPCYDNNPLPGQNPPEGLVYECYEDRYLQVATFKEYSPNKRTYPYFMIVNRRCSPYVNESNEDNRGGKRDVRVIFDGGHSELAGYNNWEIINVENGTVAGSFNKTVLTLVDLGDFMPAEGRLYQLLPTAKMGGEFLADEYIESGEEFTCEDTVWTNGHNLTIEDGVTIHFSDSAKFVVHGGTFQIGNSSHSGPNTINMDADNGSWKGFEFDTCNVKIYGVNFSGLANDSIAMLTMIDCPLIDLRNNVFSLGSNNNVWAIDINYSGSYGSSLNDNVYIANNTFLNSSAVLPYVKVMAYSGITTPVIVEGNIFEGTSTALFLNNIQGGAIKSNSFTGFGTAITALSSSLDVYSNTVSSSGTYGIQALEGTELKMSYAGGLLVGGRNNITNSSSNSYNIYLENSYFLMDEGENIFDIGTSSYHLNGWFPTSYTGDYRETENCFKVQGSVVDPPVYYVTLGEQGYQITDFVFTPYLTGCTQGGEGDMMVINLGNGIYDTIGIMGEGGSYSSNYIVTPKSIYDSISISMRYRNYANVKTLCLQLLNSYPDSVQSLGAVSKLYLAVSKTDTTTQGITDLKILYENLILNHSTNISLVKRCNYYVQKCKVLLHQYSSALSGFQQIVNQNPASYEGLIARWDYMATSLLMQGQGGGERNWDFGFAISDLKNIESDEFDNDKFSKEERKQIKQAVTTALEVSKSTEQKRREVLTELSTRGDVKATKQLKVLKSLEQTVKVERPKNIVEHMKIVTGDIQKVFVNPNAGKNASTKFIPQVFHLSQNYPNPFNPITKINYDIPQNSIVKLTIYDILGREVIKLVNNEFKLPGRYVVEFNGTNLASGVYFYRLETGEFIDSKKMVLVK